jgi:hypothetical protein
MNPKYPEVNVKLIGEDGNAFSILGSVKRAMQRERVSKEECDKFMEDATVGDYNHLLQTVMEWVTVDSDDEEDGEDRYDESYDEDDEIEEDE